MPMTTDYRARTNLRQRLETLDRGVMKRLDDAAHAVTALAGQSIISEGDAATQIFNLCQGVVCVFKLLQDGRRQVTGFLYPGDFLGVTFNTGAVYGYGAEALTPSTLRAWSRGALERLLDETPGMRRLFLAEMADELTEAQDRILLLAHRSAEERVASFILTMARRQARATGMRVETIEIPMRWADIADYLGTTAETVSRTLSALRDRGIVNTGKRGEIGILGWAELEAIAGGARPPGR